MKITGIILALTFVITMPTWAQTQKTTPMETRVINPWKWQDQRGYAQAIDVKQATSTLYCSGQTAIDAEGNASKADMRSQLIQSLENLERVIREAGYEMKHIVRLNIYTTATDELYPCFDVLMAWQAKYGLKQATTLLEVKSLFETCKVELEATAVK